MAKALDMKPFEYVLESDRGLTSDKQTVFVLRRRTVGEVNADSAAQLRRFALRTSKTESTAKIGDALTQQQAETFASVVQEVRNLVVPDSAPNGFCERYKDKFQKCPDGEGLLIDVTKERSVIQDIFFVLHSDDSAEVLAEADRKGSLSEDAKN